MDGVVSRSVVTQRVYSMASAVHGPEILTRHQNLKFHSKILLPTTHKVSESGYAPQSDWGAVHPECTQSVESAANLLEVLGHKVEIAFPQDLFNDQFFKHFRVVLAVANAATVSDLGNAIGRPLTKDDMEADTAALVSIGQSLSGMEYLNSIEWFHSYTRQMVSWVE